MLRTNAQGFISPAAVSVFLCVCVFVFVFAFFVISSYLTSLCLQVKSFWSGENGQSGVVGILLSRGRTKVTLPHKVPFFCIPFFGSNWSTSSGFFILLFIRSPANCTFRCVLMYSRAIFFMITSWAQSISPLSWSSRLSSWESGTNTGRSIWIKCVNNVTRLWSIKGQHSKKENSTFWIKNHSVHWSKKQRFCAIAAFNRIVKYSLPSRQKLTLKTCPLETINDGDSCLICGWLSKATSSDFIGTGRSNIIRRSRMRKISLCINARAGSCKATRFVLLNGINESGMD